MKWLRWRHVFMGLLLAFMATGDGIRAQSGSDWQTLAPGMQIRRLQTAKQSMLGDSKITVVRIDPALWELDLVGVVQTGEAAGHTAREWAQKHKYAAVINAGMFETDNKTHLGYMRIRDRVWNGKVNAYQSVLAFGPREGKNVPPFRIFDLDATKGSLPSVLDDYASAVQNLRLIKRPGTNQWGKQTREWSEAAVGEDRDGNVLFIYSRSPFSMHDLNQELLASGIGVVAAQHMEGGPEAQLYIHAGTTELEMFGSYETSFKENDENSAAWPVPNVIGVRPRSSPPR